MTLNSNKGELVGGVAAMGYNAARQRTPLWPMFMFFFIIAVAVVSMHGYVMAAGCTSCETGCPRPLHPFGGSPNPKPDCKLVDGQLEGMWSGVLPMPVPGNDSIDYCVIKFLKLELGGDREDFCAVHKFVHAEYPADMAWAFQPTWTAGPFGSFSRPADLPNPYLSPEQASVSWPAGVRGDARLMIGESLGYIGGKLTQTNDGSVWSYSNGTCTASYPGPDIPGDFDLECWLTYKAYLSEVSVPEPGISGAGLTWTYINAAGAYMLTGVGTRYHWYYNAGTGLVERIEYEVDGFFGDDQPYYLKSEIERYGSGKDGGPEGSIKSIRLYYKKDGSWVEKNERTYYWNYSTDDKAGKPEYIIRQASAERMHSTEGHWPDDASVDSAEFAQYADVHLDYDSAGNVTLLESGNCCGGGAHAAYGYADSTYDPGDDIKDWDYNKWTSSREDNHRLTLQSGGYGDGKVITYYNNVVGDVVHEKSELYVNGSIQQTVHRHYDYDSNGRIEKEYTPESIASATANTDGTVSLTVNSGSGLIKIWDYQDSGDGTGGRHGTIMVLMAPMYSA